MTTAELIEKRKPLLDKYTHKYMNKGKDSTDVDDVMVFFELTKEQQSILVNYCLTAFIPTKRMNHNHTSYGLKHVFAKFPDGFYVTNGQFKGAMMLAGYLPHDKTDRNWNFSIAEKCPGTGFQENQEYDPHGKARHYIPLP